MFPDRRYVPLLWGRMGELAALREATTDVRDGLTPLIELPPVAWDWEAGAPTKTISDHIASVTTRVAASWSSSPFFMDAQWLPDAGSPGISSPIEHACGRLRASGMDPVPVSGPSRSLDYQRAAAVVVADRPATGACLRVEPGDFPDLAALGSGLLRAAGVLELPPPALDLLIDLRELPVGLIGPMGLAIRTILESVPHVQDWRSVSVAGCGFPQNLSGVAADSVEIVPRSEWTLWNSLRSHRVPRLPAFADYGIGHPEPPAEIDPRIMRMSANLRYTSDNEWVVLKGRNTRAHGYEQFRDLCREMRRRAEFRGADFSWGDDFIEQCAVGTGSVGNATTWRQVGTSHHLAHVVDQLANLPSP